LSVAEFVFKIIYRLKYDLSPCPLPDLTPTLSKRRGLGEGHRAEG
jgi:hypothetical protein